MGQSERVPGLDAGLEATADRLAALMDALGLDEADIAAHSHGGAVAMMFAARHPDRVRRLILFAPANPFCDLGKPAHPLLPDALRHLVRPPDPFPAPNAEGHCAQPHVRRPVPSCPRMRSTDTPRVSHIPGTIDHVLQIVQRWFVDMGLLRSALTRLAAKPTLLDLGRPRSCCRPELRARVAAYSPAVAD